MLNRLPVVTAVDDNYVYPLLMLIWTAKHSCVRPFEFVVAFDANLLSVRSRHLVADFASAMKVPVQFRQLDIGALPVSGHISSTAYARLLLADTLDAFVWLDVDIICREGWDEILDVDPEYLEIGFAACIEDPALAEDRLAALPNQAMSAAGSRYFNSGVLLIDGKRWRASSLPARWPELARNYRELGLQFHDQDVLNYLFAGHYDQLDSSFNAQSGSAGFAGAAARILHFKGALKPWQFPLRRAWILRGPGATGSRYRDYWTQELAMQADLRKLDMRLARTVSELRARLVTHRALVATRIRQRVSSR